MKKYLFLIILFSGLFLLNGCSAPSATKEVDVIDGINFKTEYENYNENNYYLEIEKENPFKYITEDNIEEVLNGTNFIFIGYPTSAVSRAVVSMILSDYKDLGIDNIYYFNLLNNRPTFNVKNGAVTSDPDTDLYKTMKEKFSKYLVNYTVLEDKIVYNTNTKELKAPVLVLLKNGEIISYYNNFGKSDEEEFIGFGESESESFKENFSQMAIQYKK